jgi:hypothetical protein
MANRLKPLNYVDMTGGLNLRPETFQLNENELPNLLNMEVDQRGGVNTRKAWTVAYSAPAVGDGQPWDPRYTYMHRSSAGDMALFVAANHNVYRYAAGVWTTVGTGADAEDHEADFVSWADDVYLVRGGESAESSGKVDVAGTFTALPVTGAGGWANDYTSPGTPHFPAADLVTTHLGYMFVAGTKADGINRPNRLRWSHPNNPEAWAEADYIDLMEGGQRIVTLCSFADRLLVFKDDSVWALYGYDADTWEMVNVSRTIGAHSSQVVCRSESAVFFLSWPQGVFAYTENAKVEELSGQIRSIFSEDYMHPDALHQAWAGWVDRRLWLSLPYDGTRPGPDQPTSVFVFDPVLGSWTMFRGGGGCIPGPYIEAVETESSDALVALNRTTPYVIALDAVPGVAADECEPGSPEDFPTTLRTRWLDAGFPTWKKSWRRPDFLLRSVQFEKPVNVRVFHDFDPDNAQRSFQVVYSPEIVGANYGDFNWGDGTLYSGSRTTSSVERGGTMGRAGNVQLELSGAPGLSWGLNGIVFKWIGRRFR